jgi:hypothetical protein
MAQVETDRWDNEQVHGGNVRRVVTQEGLMENQRYSWIKNQRSSFVSWT